MLFQELHRIRPEYQEGLTCFFIACFLAAVDIRATDCAVRDGLTEWVSAGAARICDV